MFKENSCQFSSDRDTMIKHNYYHLNSHVNDLKIKLKDKVYNIQDKNKSFNFQIIVR